MRAAAAAGEPTTTHTRRRQRRAGLPPRRHAYEPLLAPSPAPAPPSTDTVAVAEGEALKRGEVVEFKLATWGENWTPALSPPKRARVSRSQGGELTLEMDEGSPLEIPQRELRELRRVVADSQDSAALAEPEALEEAQAPPASSVARRTRSRRRRRGLPAPKRRAPAPPLSPISSPSVSEVRKGSKSSRKRPRKAAGGAGGASTGSTPHETTPDVKGGPNDTTAAPAPAVEEKVPEAAPRGRRTGRSRRALLADLAARRRGARSEEGEAVELVSKGGSGSGSGT